MRSVLQHFRPYIRRFKLLTGDFPNQIPQRTNHNTTLLSEQALEEELTKNDRLGQIPQWLSESYPSLGETWHDDSIKLDVHHHAQFFEAYPGATFNRCARLFPAIVLLTKL